MYKQIIIARKDLNMSPGKLAAQVSHGSMAFLTNAIRSEAVKVPNLFEMKPRFVYDVNLFSAPDLYEQWIDGSFTKCVLQARNKSHLLKAKTLAEEMGMREGVNFFLIKDNCCTELEPEETDENGVGRTLTCIGFALMEAEMIDKIGKKYHLYM